MQVVKDLTTVDAMDKFGCWRTSDNNEAAVLMLSVATVTVSWCTPLRSPSPLLTHLEQRQQQLMELTWWSVARHSISSSGTGSSTTAEAYIIIRWYHVAFWKESRFSCIQYGLNKISWRLWNLLNYIQCPYHTYIRCFSTFNCCGWAYGCTLTLLVPQQMFPQIWGSWLKS